MLRLESTFARAVVPVLGGIVLIAAMGGLTWAIAAYISRDGTDASERLAPTTFVVGDVESLAGTVAEDGPLLFPELGTAIGTRSIVVDHTGDDPTDGWRVYAAYPADRDPSCVVTLHREHGTLEDCEGRTVGVADLAPPDAGVVPRVDDRETLIVDFRAAADAPRGASG